MRMKGIKGEEKGVKGRGEEEMEAGKSIEDEEER